MKLANSTLLIAGLVAFGSVLAADQPQTNLQLTMLTKVNQQGLALWDITNGAMGDNGVLEASKLKPGDWAKLLEIGKGLEEGGRALSTKGKIVAAVPGAKLQDEENPGAAKAADVQRFIDAQPAKFREHALKLQQTGAGVFAAARKHDVKQLADFANGLDEVCENCHKIFWYPNLAR